MVPAETGDVQKVLITRVPLAKDVFDKRPR